MNTLQSSKTGQKISPQIKINRDAKKEEESSISDDDTLDTESMESDTY